MRVDLKKYVFIGLQTERDAFFQRAQDVGIVDFIPSESKKLGGYSHEVETITQAIKILRGLPTAEQEDTEEFVLADGLAFKITELHKKIENLQEEQRTLALEIVRVSPFGDFSLDELHELEREGNRKVQFFCARSNLEESEALPPSAVFVTHDQGLDYYVSISREPIHSKEMIEMQIEKPLGVLQERQRQVEAEIRDLEKRLKGYAKYDNFLHKALLFKLDTENLKTASGFANKAMDGELFAVEGWVPVTKVAEMETLVDEMHVFADEIATEEQDVIPTCLENEGMHRVGEDLVHIYDTPAATDKDPSMWVLVFFALFFSIIMGDGGYGLVFLATALFLRFKFADQMQGAFKRFWKLFMVLSVSCIAWGLVTNSFFGMDLKPTNPVRAYSPISWVTVEKMRYSIEQQDETYKEALKKYKDVAGITDPRAFLLKAYTEKEGDKHYELADALGNGVMMELALVIGILHISLSFLRYFRRNWAGIGWIILMIGAFLYFPVYLNTPSFLNYVFGLSFAEAQLEGEYLMMGGFTLAIVLALIQHRIYGLLEPMTIIQILADVLSYLRLYALGLAGGIVAATVNEFAAGASFVFAAILLIIGHATNIVLSIMGGVIHGLRLNFIEWYHYSFDGGGKMYNPLRKLIKAKQE